MCLDKIYIYLCQSFLSIHTHSSLLKGRIVESVEPDEPVVPVEPVAPVELVVPDELYGPKPDKQDAIFWGSLGELLRGMGKAIL